MPRVTLGDAFTGILALCALLLTGLSVRRELRPREGTAALPVREVPDWRRFSETGHEIGSATAPVTIVAFSDFQCPFCKQLASEIDSVRRWYPGKVRFVYRYYPLGAVHPQAVMAAVAAECAGLQGRFGAFHDALFHDQKALGARRWVEFAVSAGIVDTTRFAQCVRDSAVVMPRIRKDIAAGEQLGVSGTPTLLVNGHFFAGVPGPSQLRQLVAQALEDR
ncbi:MAG TPA: thioredoxin domain-containing protein [Gemmatimonadaceae bacterium]|nr:thioredoxin domain-containing protein [Gemmatimonadaceae bacterium]